ncbi:MAG: type II toxin-antitoxin system VapC family toxin [Rubrivivax sp.]|nr:type II toxin-antitoxin system VapC family toxin [Rubrivivax sp.]
MKAVDTNVLARFLVDDPDDAEAARQRQVALRVFSQPVFVPLTVLLEFSWLIQGFYKFPRPTVAAILGTLLGLEHVLIEHRGDVAGALELFKEHTLDFADALHLTRSSQMQALLTFDKQFAKRVARARKLASVVAVELLDGR